MSTSNHRIAALLLGLSGVLLVVAGLACSPFLAGRLAPRPLDPVTAGALPAARATLLWIGVALIGSAGLLARAPADGYLSRPFDRPLVTKLLVSVLAAGVILALVEIGLRPFTIARETKKQTTLFIRDADLGWRLRPGVTAPWGGVEITVNSKGLRGPEIAYARDAAKPRLLYLGDSVTIGYGLARYDDAYPYRIGALLEQALGRSVETVNTAVNGYASWQEQVFLEREGLRYDPDVVILGFVLNDVTEPLGLVRFGGTGIGYQLERSYFSLDDWLRHNSVLYALSHRLAARIRFGPDVRKGAVARELVSVEDLARAPGSPRVRQAWATNLESLAKIADLCAARGVPLAIVVFPFTFQFEDPRGLSAPQARVKAFCKARGVACLDLLPLLASHLESRHQTPQALFLDPDHLSVRGSKVVARLVVAWLRSQPRIWSRIARP